MKVSVRNRRLRVTSDTRLRQGSFYITASQPASQPPTSVLCQMLSRALPSAAYTQALPTIHSKQSCCLCNPQSLRKQNEGYLKGQRVWGRRIVWCTLTSWYLVSLLPVSIIHVSVILLVGFWTWEISFIMWGCRGWGWQVAGTWVSVSREMVGFPSPIGWPGASQSICTQ